MQNLIYTKEYQFLHTHPNLKDNIIFLAVGGSHAYGTNVETSDIDLRGVCHNTTESLIGLSPFEQVIDNKTDTTIYAFNKFVKLLTNCNPNVIELLGCNPEHYLMMSESGKELINNRKMFLSKKAISSFGGYARQQLRRLQNGIITKYKSHGDITSPEKLHKHAMHLVRLYLMVFDILEKEEIITYRKDNISLLMKIRNGEYYKEDGTYHQEFFDMIEEYEKRLDYAAKNTNLPSKPNFKSIEEMVMGINLSKLTN